MITGFGDLPELPSGVIIIWDDIVSTIPSGWVLCDGSNGTPDMNEKYVSADAGYSIGFVGGNEFVTLSEANMPRHTHSCTTDVNGEHSHRVYCRYERRQFTPYTGDKDASIDMDPPTANEDRKSTFAAGTHTHTVNSITSVGSGAPIDIKPRTYRANFIMKL